MKHTFIPSKYYLTYGLNEPALKIKAGDTIVAPTVDAGGYDNLGNVVSTEKMQQREDTEYYRANPLVGPFYVEGAELGDTLAVHIERMVLNRDMAWSSIVPHFGSFTEEGPNRILLLNEPLERIDFTWALDLNKKIGTLDLSSSGLERIEVPLNPFIGSIGVAPRYGRCELSLTPGEYGGNMDCVETKEGTILYLPVFVQGAYLSFGDIHAAQGDGEICGVALETTAEVTLRLEVIKDKLIHWPRMEDEEFIMVAGSSKPLMEAFKIAHLDLLNWLVTEYSFNKWEGFQALSQVGTCRVGNVVDPKYTVVAKFPKKYLPL